MNDSKFKVLLYSDGSHQAFSAAIYAATLLKKTPNMHLTILQIKKSGGGSKGTESRKLELKPKYKKNYWGCSSGAEYSWINSWPVYPNPDWMKGVLGDSEFDVEKQYERILAKTNEIYSKRRLNVKHQVICANAGISDTIDIPETVDSIIGYATKNSIQLIIMGTRGPSTLKGLIFGSLAHNVLNKSTKPVLLIKKLPQDYIDSYLSETEFNHVPGIPKAEDRIRLRLCP